MQDHSELVPALDEVGLRLAGAQVSGEVGPRGGLLRARKIARELGCLDQSRRGALTRLDGSLERPLEYGQQLGIRRTASPTTYSPLCGVLVMSRHLARAT